MTTEINAANSAQVKTNSIGTAKTEELSDETKRQLEALGISVTTGMTEAEAQELIDEAQEDDELFKAPQAADSFEVSSDIKTLASVVGLSYEDNDSADEILVRIAEELEAQIDDAENNPQALSTLMGYYHKLSDLDAQLDAVQQGQSKLFNAMDLMAANNRKQFGF